MPFTESDIHSHGHAGTDTNSIIYTNCNADPKTDSQPATT